MSYLRTNPHSPATLWQHSGMGDYENVGDYAWEYYGPNAFAWEAPADSAAQPAPILPNPAWFSQGLSGGCGCGGKCGGCGDGHKHGVGQASTGAGLFGTGLFSSTDVSTWGIGEWALLAIGILGTLNVLGGIAGAGKSVSRSYKKRQRRQKKIAEASL